MKALFKNQSKPLLSIFTTAGYPKIDDLDRQLALFDSKNVNFIELGIPFSDPMADGPTIQETSTIALQNGMNLDILFGQLNERKSTLPIVLMGYLNPILLFGLERFLELSKKANVSGFIIPDLEIDLYQERYKSIFEAFEIPVCFLVTPRTTDARIQKAAELSKNGFVYLVSTNSITGGEVAGNNKLSARYEEIKSLCGATPVMIGFGISDRHSFNGAAKNLNGGIIGSAYLKALKKGEETEFLNQF
ncbi:MAG: tryptophan synthase subunit alpha [Fluviicola sp.]|nr:MAG: tryptophan synthase subunit alpha [Fluviicola sp.]